MLQFERYSALRWARDHAPGLLATIGLLLIGALLVATAITLLPIIDEIARIERARLPTIQLLQTARNEDLNASVAVRNVLLVKNPALDEKEVERYRRANQSASAALDDLARRFKKPEAVELLNGVRAAHTRLQAIRDRALDLDRRGLLRDADGITPELQAALDDYLAELGRLQARQSARTVALIDDMAERAGATRLLLAVCGAATALTLLSMGLAWRAELRRQVTQRETRIASLQSQKAALVSEVHHRIKNHLQGLLGLLETHRLSVRDPSLVGSLETLHGHVLALVGIHGMQARGTHSGISLNDLMRQQLELVRAGFPRAQLAFTEDDKVGGVVLPADQAVPVALMTTELVVNAIKHGQVAPIRVSIGMGSQGCPYVSVTNLLSSPTRMDWPSGRGLGTGLSLVSTLSEGIAEVTQRSSQQEMIMTLLLRTMGPSGAS
jgi:two-component sensor histidine kinase